MTHLAIIDYTPEGITVVRDFGACELAAYVAQMTELTQAKNDWDSLCNTILNTLMQAGILREDGFSNAGHTYNDVLRAIAAYAEEARKAAKKAYKIGGPDYAPTKIDEFLLETEGMLLVKLLGGLSVVGKKGHDIIIAKDQAEAVFHELLKPIKHQLLRDESRRALIEPIMLYYGIDPDHALEA